MKTNRCSKENLHHENRRPVAELVSAHPTPSPRMSGLMKGKLTVIVEDDEHLKDFEEYMP